MDQNEKYTFLYHHPLGEGAQGKILKCQSNKNPNQFYAAKIIKKYKEDDDDYRFQNKLTMNEKLVIQKLQQVSNKNLINIHEVYEDDNCIYIIMEFCEQGDLKKEIKKRKENQERFKAEQIIDFIFQIVEGFLQIFVNQIIHRDFKPENIFLKNENGKTIYVIGDFGISRIVENYNLEGQYTKICTKIYQSPQQFFKSQYSGKTDIFSFGLVLYELIYFRLPYTQETLKEFHEQLMQQKKLQFNIDLIEGSSQDKQYITEILTKTLTYDENDRLDWRQLKYSKEKYLKTNFFDKNQIELEKQLKIVLNVDTTFRHLLGFFMSNFELGILIHENFNNQNTLNYFQVSEINQKSFNIAVRYFQYLNLNSIGAIYYQKYNQFSLKNKISSEEFELETKWFLNNFNSFDSYEFSRWHHLFSKFKNFKEEINQIVQEFNQHKIKFSCMAEFLKYKTTIDYIQSLEFVEEFLNQLITKQFKIQSVDLTKCSESLLNFLYLVYQVKELKEKNIDLASLKSKIYNLDQNNVVNYLLDQQQMIEQKNQ